MTSPPCPLLHVSAGAVHSVHTHLSTQLELQATDVPRLRAAMRAGRLLQCVATIMLSHRMLAWSHSAGNALHWCCVARL
jgi:hypothetical protein